MRTVEEISKELSETSRDYKGLNKGSPKFKAVSLKLVRLDAELAEARNKK